MKKLLLVAAVATTMLLIPSSASAAVSCNLTGGVLTVDVTGAGTQQAGLRMTNGGTDIGVYDAIAFTGLQACTNGPATVSNTNSIVIADTDAGVQRTLVHISEAGGTFTNAVAEGGGTPEIEITYNGGNEFDDDLILDGRAIGQDDHWRMGELPGGEGYQLDDTEAVAAADVDDLLTVGVEELQIGINGNPGDDVIDGRGGAGFTGPLTPGSTTAQLVAGTGDDQLFAGNGNGWRLEGDEGADSQIGGPGNDFIQLSFGTDGDIADGNGGADICSYQNHNEAVNVDLRITDPQNTGGAGVDTISDCETLSGGNGADTLIATNGPNSIFAGPGNDTLLGLDGNDTLDGGADNDTVSYAQGSTGPVSVTIGAAGAQNTVGAGNDTITTMENLTGSPFSDTLTGDGNANTIDAYDGILDTVACAGGADIAIADEIGVDTLAGCETTDNAPKVSVAAAPADDALLNSATPTYDLTADEPATFQVSVDGGAFTACPAACKPAALSDGAHALAFRAVDTDENLHPGLNAVSRTVTIDTLAPEVQIVDGPTGNTEDTTPTFGFAVAGAATTECRVDAEAFAPCSGPGSSHTTGALTEGAHTFEVRGTDAAGNSATASRAFTITAPVVTPPPVEPDITAPETTIKKVKVKRDGAKIKFSANESGSTFQCKLDKGPFRPCTSPAKFRNLDSGKHKVKVVATDVVGNKEASAARAKFRI